MTIAFNYSDFALALAIAGGCLIVGYIIWWVGDRAIIRARKRRAVVGSQPADSDESEDKALFNWLDNVVFGHYWARGLMVKLERAGLNLRPSEFVALASGVCLVLALLFGLMLKFSGSQFIGLLVGIIVSWAYLQNKCARRLAAFNGQLPDALTLISSAVRHGAAFERAAALVQEEMPAPISEEFGRMLADTEVGIPLEDALARMVDRMGSYDLELSAIAVVVNRQLGGSLSEVLDNISGVIRDRVRLDREVSALTVEGRMSGVILFILPFVLAGLIYVLNPAYVKVLFTDPVGLRFVAGAIVLQIVGGFIIRSILKIDY